MPIRVTPMRRPGRPKTATTALVPAAARRMEVLTDEEVDRNGEAIETFTRAVGGRRQLTDVLAVAESAPEVDRVVTYLLDPKYQRWSLRRLCTLAGITIADLFVAYKKASLAKAHIEASHLIAKKLLPVVEDVMTRAAPAKVPCSSCGGIPTTPPCRTCRGTGWVTTEPDLDRQKLALELGHLTERKGGLIVQQNQGILAAAAISGPQAGLLEQLHQAVGDLLFSPTRQRVGAPRRAEEVPPIIDPPSEPDTFPRDEPESEGPPPDDDGDDDEPAAEEPPPS